MVAARREPRKGVVSPGTNGRRQSNFFKENET
jgi:hypothetical protein